MLKTAPAVFAVGNEYQIMVEVERESLMYVKVGEKTYYDESNGIMNSRAPIHRVSVPMKALDNAKEYTVFIRPIIERKPYFTETEEPIEYTYKFCPVPEKNARAYHISDAHNRAETAIEAAKTFGDIDFLIFNGDVIDHSGDPENFFIIYEISAALTNGSKPVVFSRGNHDLRGNFAENFAEYTPNHNKNTYYSFKLGSIWGLVLDCGEDKPDDHPEYGYTVACHVFRERQTEYIKAIIENQENEFGAKDVKTKLVIAHNPFTRNYPEPFNIEHDLFREWARLLKEEVKPDLMLCGHKHECVVHHVGGENDYLGQPCPVVIGAEPDFKEKTFTGSGFVFEDDQIRIIFTNSLGNIVSEEIIKK